MKKFFNIMLLQAVALLLFSCGPAEVGNTFNLYYDNIYTVNKHTLTAEDSDSVIRIDNMDNAGFKTGDRAYMILRHYYDYNVMKRPHIDIYYAGEVIPTYPLSPKDSIDVAEYTAPFDSLYRFEFLDRYAAPVWIKKNRQNINISYFGAKEGASFAMTVRGVSEIAGAPDKACLELNLYAKAQRDGNATVTRLLTFDLSGLDGLLDDGQKSALQGKKALRTKIYLSRETDGAVKEVSIIGGELDNPFK